MAKYIKCPRCELNWITSEQELCDVCKAELRIGGMVLLEDDEDEEDRVCPICHINFLDAGEKICSDCKDKQAAKQLAASLETDDAIVPDPVNAEIEVSFSQIESEENWEEAAEELPFADGDFTDIDLPDDLLADEIDPALIPEGIELDDLDDEEEEEEEEVVKDELDDDFKIDEVDASEFEADDEEDDDDEDEKDDKDI